MNQRIMGSSSYWSLFFSLSSPPFFSFIFFSPFPPFFLSFLFFFNLHFLSGFTSLLSSSFSFLSTSFSLSFPLFILSSSFPLPIYSCFPLIFYRFVFLSFCFLYMQVLSTSSKLCHTHMGVKSQLKFSGSNTGDTALIC